MGKKGRDGKGGREGEGSQHSHTNSQYNIKTRKTTAE